LQNTAGYIYIELFFVSVDHTKILKKKEA